MNDLKKLAEEIYNYQPTADCMLVDEYFAAKEKDIYRIELALQKVRNDTIEEVAQKIVNDVNFAGYAPIWAMEFVAKIRALKTKQIENK